MIKQMTIFIFASGVVLDINVTLADLNNPTYLEGKKAYTADNCSDAVRLLEQYEAEDSIFLSENVDVKKKIDQAILQCKQNYHFHFSGETHGVTTNTK